VSGNLCICLLPTEYIQFRNPKAHGMAITTIRGRQEGTLQASNYINPDLDRKAAKPNHHRHSPSSAQHLCVCVVALVSVL
jgi:hypothetical protein